MNLWRAKVLDSHKTSYASDVYSFGMVVWEVLARDTPWATLRDREMFVRVVIKGERPAIPADAPADIADVMRACWASVPRERPSSQELMAGMKSRGYNA